ncbi:MAG: hypothetical protein WB919_09175 [Candidatus Sulfotelmatobacter sp.]
MLKNQDPDRNIQELTDEEIYSAIRYLEPHSESNERQRYGGGFMTAIILLILLLGVIAFVWFCV